MPRQPANRNDRPLRIPRWKYDAFLSYSIGADYRQADRIKKFLEGSHNEPGLDIHRLKQLKIFRDGNDLRMAAGGAQPSAAANSQPDDKIKKNFIPYLEQSKTLLILWPGKSAATPFMEWELEEFLRQNRQRGWERKVYLAVTRGEDPAKSSEQFFSRLQLKIGLNGNLFFDLRGQHPAAKGWCKVLDYEYESLRLAVELAGPVDEKNAPLSAGDLFPGWLREKERQRQREEELQRKAFARKAALAGHLLPQSPVTALALAAAVWKTVDTHESRQALAGVLVGTHGLDTHLSRPEAEAHVGPVRDVAFLGDDFLLSIDHGTGAINDERPGALCVWNIAERRFCHREPRMGGTCVLGIGRDRVVVANGSSLIAARWYDDYENRVGFRSRWNFQGSFSVPIEHLAVEPEDELIAAAGGDKLVILRDGDGAFIREWKAPGQIRALAWSGPRTLILGVEETLMTFDVESGRV